MWILIAILLTVIAGTAIFIPFLRQHSLSAAPVGLDPRLARLYAERDTLYQALRDAKFDLETGKLSSKDYEKQTALLKHQAAQVLRAIDQLEMKLISPELDERIEEMVAEHRQEPEALKGLTMRTEASAAQAVGGYCVHCGGPLAAGDRFCGTCGQPVRK